MKILLVDDHAILRASLKRILQDEFPEFEVGEAANADETIRQLRTQRWDLVVLDISLPGRSGLDLLPEIHSQYPTTKVIVLSHFDDGQFVIRAFRAGAGAFLTKERAAKELFESIRRVTTGRRFIAANIAEQLAEQIANDRPQNPHDRLSKREFEVFRLIANAKPPARIAKHLGISIKTVSTYRMRILEKIGMSSNAELMQYAIRNELV